MMKTRIEELWDAAAKWAAQKPLHADELRLTRIDVNCKFDVYAGIDGGLRPLFAVGLSFAPPKMDLESDSIEYFRQQRAGGSWVMALRLHDTELEPVFGRLAQDLSAEIESVVDQATLAALFTRRLRLWEQLFRNGRNGLLAAHQVRGLVGELLCFLSLLATKSAEEVAMSWVGPYGADQDFVFDEAALEVKTIQEHVKSVSISSLEQLESDRSLLELRVLTLRAAPNGNSEGMTLNALVAQIESRFAASPLALQRFKDALKETGYTQHPEYDKVFHVLGSSTRYVVGPGFPRLTRETVTSEIETAHYTLSLHAISPHAVQGS
jgi:hypothetical protein